MFLFAAFRNEEGFLFSAAFSALKGTVRSKITHGRSGSLCRKEKKKKRHARNDTIFCSLT